MAEEREAVEAGDMQQGAALADEQDAFLTEHVLPWLAPWRYAVETTRAHPTTTAASERSFSA